MNLINSFKCELLVIEKVLELIIGKKLFTQVR